MHADEWPSYAESHVQLEFSPTLRTPGTAKLPVKMASSSPGNSKDFEPFSKSEVD